MPADPKKTLYLIDGYAQFFRAYHAIRTPMTSPVTGERTNLTFGFVGMLLKLLRGEGKVGGTPGFVAVALDVSGDRGTFRSEIDPAYKATRPPPPEDLPQQVDRCLAILGELDIPVIGSPGFEADDVIATIATSLEAGKAEGIEHLRIVSKDKDLKQLLSDRVQLYDIHHDTVIDVQSLKAETGLSPAQVVDMLALMGDTVDNIRGVEGVGPKTAAQLIEQYGSLDSLIAHASEIKGKRGEKLREAIATTLPTARQLVELQRDAPIDFDPDRARIANFRLARLAPICKELGFSRYQDEINDLLKGPRPALLEAAPADSLFASIEPRSRAADGTAYACITTIDELDRFIASIDGVLAIDTETTALRAMRADLVGISLATEPGSAVYIPVRSPEPHAHLDPETVLARLGPLLSDPSLPKIGHNLKYDLLVLRRAGVELRGLGHPESCDSMVASYLIDASRSSHGLDALSLALLGRENISITELIGSGKHQKRFDEVPLADATRYAAEDADVSLQLAEMMKPQLRAMKLDRLAQEVELPLVAVLAELEYNGILVDPGELSRQEARLSARDDELKRVIRDMAMQTIGREFDPDSPKQLAGILFNKPDAEEPGLGLRPLKRGKTGPSTDAEVLEKLAQDASIESAIPALILEHRQLAKLVGTYLVALREEINPQTGRIHASFNQTVAATGRLSSSDPNLQNIPIRTDLGREIRRAFVAPEGRVLISADYSQIELRLLAHLSDDPGLIDAFRAGHDIHRAVAAQIHGVPESEVTREQRNGAKMVNFGIVYGITPYGLARRLGVSNTEADEIITGYKERFRGITEFLEACIAQAKRHGHVETMLGRRRPIPDIDSTNPQRRSLAERMAINSVVQGSAADLIKLAMIDLHARLSPRAAHLRGGASPDVQGVLMLLQIHDELVFEADHALAEQAEAIIVDRMQSAMSLKVPLVVESSVSRNWYEGK